MKKRLSKLVVAVLVISTCIIPAQAIDVSDLDFLNDVEVTLTKVEEFPLDTTDYYDLDQDDKIEIEVLEDFVLSEDEIIEASSKEISQEDIEGLDLIYPDKSIFVQDEKTTRTGKPDLMPTNFSRYNGFEPPFPTDEYILFTVDIYNIGSGDAPTVPIEFLVDGVVQQTMDAGPLAAGRGRKIEMNIKSNVAGSHTLGIGVNPGFTPQVDEENYNNNFTSVTHEWIPFSLSVDMNAVSIGSNYGTRLPVDTEIQFVVSVGNAGGLTASAPMVVAINNTPIVSGNTGPIPGKKRAEYTFNLSFNREVTFDMQLMVDPEKTITEWRTYNNNLEETFSVFTEEPVGYKYGRLGFTYPLSSDYKKYFPNYPNHKGLDISAPKDADIYSIDDGYVVYAGDFGDTGNHIVVRNNTIDPYKGGSNNIITRYLHINKPQNMFVGAGDNVVAGQLIGLVGSKGAYVGDQTYNHLHIDANSSNITHTGPGAQYINPYYFWPDELSQLDYSKDDDQMWPGNPDVDYNSLELNYIEDGNFDVIENGRYIDLSLIKYVGFDEYENWRKLNENSTVYDLVEEYKISDDQLKNMMASHIYEEYLKYKPN